MFLTIYTFTLPCSYPYILSPFHVLIHIYTFTLPCSNPPILSPFHPLIHPSFHPSMFLSIYPFTLPCSYPYILSPFILSLFYSSTLIHSSIHPFIHLRLAMFVQTIFIQTLRAYCYSDLACLWLFRPCVPIIIQTLRDYGYSDLKKNILFK